VLVRALERRLTGTFDFVVFGVPAGKLLVIEGQPAKAQTAVPHYLVGVLAQLGVLTHDTVSAWLPRLLSGTELHGRALAREGVVTEEQVELGLRAQLVRQMHSLAELPPETTFRYHDGVDALASYGGESPVRLDPYPFVWASLRKQPPWGHVGPALANVDDTPFRLARDAETDRFAFDAAQRETVELLRRRRWTLDQLVVASELSSEDVHLLVYCLLLTRQVELLPITDDVATTPAGGVPSAATFDASTVIGRDSWLVLAPDSTVEGEASAEVAFAPPAPVVLEAMPTPTAQAAPVDDDPLPPTLDPARDPVPDMYDDDPDDAGPATVRVDVPALDRFSRPTPALGVSAVIPPEPPPARPDPPAEVFTRPTVRNLSAITPEMEAAYRTEQQADTKAATTRAGGTRALPAAAAPTTTAVTHDRRPLTAPEEFAPRPTIAFAVDKKLLEAAGAAAAATKAVDTTAEGKDGAKTAEPASVEKTASIDAAWDD
jgi:hypothetical protein